MADGMDICGLARQVLEELSARARVEVETLIVWTSADSTSWPPPGKAGEAFAHHSWITYVAHADGGMEIRDIGWAG
ncbi:hypothetical protein HYE82_03465 [Streptomyces sp. BR123]|uniref:hypothetical protein n=1 Tax=Streptomyces sp. BR123 TaxID=2749828 RepID=UPI0015C4A49E|nr:hypothetical protein [Streptomyces sp. BR123]NXY93480.1 hypothetical protein [Streptomyces sp. BR123]